jgi:hypothetical protein
MKMAGRGSLVEGGAKAHYLISNCARDVNSERKLACNARVSAAISRI